VWRNDTDNAAGRHWDAEGICWNGLPPRYALCVDSLLAIAPSAFTGAVVVLDEAEQLLQHMLMSATCSHQRGLIIQRLQQIIKGASQVVALDADLSDATLLWLAGGQEQEIALIEAAGKAPSPWRVHWHGQARPEQAQAELAKAAAAGPVFITTDSREAATAIHELLQQQLPEAKGLLITSATTDTPEVKAWLSRLTDLEALAAGAIRWVVASTSISSGLSIEHGHFRSVWGW
jgi:Lhr-like helicases